MTNIPEELVERMIEIIRRFDTVPATERGPHFFTNLEQDAKELTAQLPDADLERVRKIAQEHGVMLTDAGAQAIADYFRGRGQ